MRTRYVLTFTLLVVVGSFLYYMGWRTAKKQIAEAAASATVNSVTPEPRHEKTMAAARRHQPESGGPPTSSWPAAPPAPGPAASAGAPSGRILLPLPNLKREAIQDTFNQVREGGTRKHEATDILAPRGTPVMAMVDGTIRKLFLSKPGGLTIYEFDSTEEYSYYYAHLDRYAENLREGMQVRAGDVIGYVGTSGNADPNTPHLHLAIFRLGPEKRWWQGTPVNPYPILIKLVR